MLTLVNRFVFLNGKYSLREFYTSQCIRSSVSQLSPYDVNLILRENEYTHSFTEGSIKGYDSNQLGSNSPIEDCRTEANVLNEHGFLCGIFDGHGGPSCSQVVSKRLLRYISASVQNRDVLRHLVSRNEVKSQTFLSCHNDKVDFVQEVKNLYEESFQKYVTEILKEDMAVPNRSEAIAKAFLQLDNHISEEALEHTNVRTLAVAMSGVVACVSLIENCDVYVASTGDCTAVLGSITDTGQWVSKKLTQEHNTDNIPEVKRILNEHPDTERETIIRNERLLGQLAPLRALGDFRYKWSNEILQQVIVPEYGEMCIPPNYYTPPYLTSLPDVTHHQLLPNDRFMIIASDGLWDFISPMQAVGLVAEHMAGKAFLQPLKLPQHGATLGEISKVLEKRRAGRKKKPLDKNAATHLIRNALGGTEYGIEHSKISHILSLPQDVVRLFRDDITITVIYFDPDFVKSQPPI